MMTRLRGGVLGGHRWLAVMAGVVCLVFPRAPRADVGGLTPRGCIQNTSSTDCPITTAGLGEAFAVAVSPDGANVYVASRSPGAVAVFARGADGTLTPQGCIEQTGGTSCATTAPGLDGATDVAVSPDGSNVYVASEDPGAIAVFKRNPDGTLTPAGCIQDTSGLECAGIGGTTPGLAGAAGVAVSPDGANVYVTGESSNALVSFVRGTNGALTPIGCIQNIGGTACGAIVPGLAGATSVTVSPDGANVYVTGGSSDAVGVLTRGAGGALTWVGCVQNAGGTDCAGVGGTAPGLIGPKQVAVSPDGANVYVVSYSSYAIAVFTRGSGGSLTPRGCIENGPFACTSVAPGLLGPNGVMVSPDGASVYVASELGGTIAAFSRGPDGALTPGACIANTGDTTCPSTAAGLDGVRGVAVSPDGANVYFASYQSHAIVTFARERPPTTTTTLSTPTTTLPCPADGVPGLRCVLAPGLGQPACAADRPPKAVARRFARALKLLDRIEARPARARRLLGRMAHGLARIGRAVDKAADRGRLSEGCGLALDAMLLDGRERAARLADAGG